MPAATSEIVLAGANGYWRLTLKAMCLKLTMAPGSRACRYCDTAPCAYLVRLRGRVRLRDRALRVPS